MAVEALARTFLLGLTLVRNANGLRSAVRIALLRATFVALAFALLLTALGFLLAAAYMVMADFVGPVYSALIVAGVLMLKAWFWMALSKRVGAGRRRRAER